MIIQALKKGLIEHEASDTGGVPRWKSSCPDRLAEATTRRYNTEISCTPIVDTLYINSKKTRCESTIGYIRPGTAYTYVCTSTCSDCGLVAVRAWCSHRDVATSIKPYIRRTWCMYCRGTESGYPEIRAPRDKGQAETSTLTYQVHIARIRSEQYIYSFLA